MALSLAVIGVFGVFSYLGEQVAQAARARGLAMGLRPVFVVDGQLQRAQIDHGGLGPQGLGTTRGQVSQLAVERADAGAAGAASISLSNSGTPLRRMNKTRIVPVMMPPTWAGGVAGH